MSDILLRIRKIFNDSQKTQTQIGKQIHKTSQYVWKILNDDSANPSDSVIIDICREFNVNEEWLRHGTGEMYRKKDTAFSELIAEIDYSDDEFLKNIITAYMGLDEDSKQALRKIAKSMAEKYKGQS